VTWRKAHPRCRTRLGRGAFLPLALAVWLGAAAPTPLRADPDPIGQPRLEFETGVLWHVTGSASPLDYVLQPEILSYIGPLNYDWHLWGGDLVMRPRFSLLWEPILQGPEHHYYAASASCLLEWWNRPRTASLFLTSGGGLGWIDAKGQQIAGAQGQEFNLNWLIYAGARLRLAPRWTASLGLYFQHVSNGHFNKVDPGINAFGPIVNVGWQF
jgi:lipid A 3-O-deacylase